MTLSAAVVRELVRAGLEGEGLIAACERIEEADPSLTTRTARQERNHRYYETHKASEKRLKASYSDVSEAGSPSLEKGPAPPDPLTPKTQPTPSPPIVPPAPKSAREELAVVLDAEHAAAVVEHRQRIGKPMTRRAGMLLARRFAQCDDPNAAADEMIAGGWQGFKPGWLKDRERPSTGPPPKPTLGDLLRRTQEYRQQTDDQQPPRPPDLRLISATR